MASLKPYVIWAPDYRRVSGGIRCLYLLAHLLRERGFDASVKIMYEPCPWRENPWGVPQETGWPTDAINVYPEILPTNPVGSNRFVRIVFGQPDERFVPLDGLKFTWHPKLGPWPLLHLPYIDTNVFHPGDAERSGVLVWHGKNGVGAVPNGAKVISYGWPSSHEELAGELRRAEWLLAYDGYSAVIHEAILCGCPVVVRDPKWSYEDLISSPLPLPGVTDSEAGLVDARVAVRGAFEAWVRYSEVMERQLDVFVEQTQALP